jgi:hypothetical protein
MQTTIFEACFARPDPATKEAEQLNILQTFSQSRNLWSIDVKFTQFCDNCAVALPRYCSLPSISMLAVPSPGAQ